MYPDVMKPQNYAQGEIISRLIGDIGHGTNLLRGIYISKTKHLPYILAKIQ